MSLFVRILRKLSIDLNRWVDGEYYRWTNKRHTGLTVSWHYTPAQEVQPDPSFTEENTSCVSLMSSTYRGRGAWRVLLMISGERRGGRRDVLRERKGRLTKN